MNFIRQSLMMVNKYAFGIFVAIIIAQYINLGVFTAETSLYPDSEGYITYANLLKTGQFTEALNNPRTFVVPLIYALFNVESSNTQLIPSIHYLMYAIALLVLFKALTVHGLSKLQSLAFCSPLLFSSVLSPWLTALLSEIIGVSFLILSYAFAIIVSARHQRKLLFSVALALSIFATYQARPAFIFIVGTASLLFFYLRLATFKRIRFSDILQIGCIALIPIVAWSAFKSRVAPDSKNGGVVGISLLGIAAPLELINNGIANTVPDPSPETVFVQNIIDQEKRDGQSHYSTCWDISDLSFSSYTLLKKCYGAFAQFLYFATNRSIYPAQLADAVPHETQLTAENQQRLALTAIDSYLDQSKFVGKSADGMHIFSISPNGELIVWTADEAEVIGSSELFLIIELLETDSNRNVTHLTILENIDATGNAPKFTIQHRAVELAISRAIETVENPANTSGWASLNSEVLDTEKNAIRRYITGNIADVIQIEDVNADAIPDLSLQWIDGNSYIWLLGATQQLITPNNPYVDALLLRYSTDAITQNWKLYAQFLFHNTVQAGLDTLTFEYHPFLETVALIGLITLTAVQLLISGLTLRWRLIIGGICGGVAILMYQRSLTMELVFSILLVHVLYYCLANFLGKSNAAQDNLYVQWLNRLAPLSALTLMHYCFGILFLIPIQIAQSRYIDPLSVFFPGLLCLAGIFAMQLAIDTIQARAEIPTVKVQSNN